MSTIPALHFLVGCCSVLAGFLSMFSRKGLSFHKFAGRVFVYAMLILCISGFYLSFARNLQFTFLLSALSLYLVFTGWFSVKNKTQGITPLDKLGLAFILLFSIVCFLLAIFGIVLGWDYPASEPSYGAYAFIGAMAALFFLGDLRFVKALAPAPSVRFKRHLTRMCSSMLIATTIFFLGNNHVLPDFMRNAYELLTPIILVILVLLIYRMGFQRLVKGHTK